MKRAVRLIDKDIYFDDIVIAPTHEENVKEIERVVINESKSERWRV